MKFSTAKTASTSLLIAGLSIGCIGIFVLDKGSSGYIATEVLMMALFVAGMVIAYVWGRCPKCGARLFYRLNKWKQCPRCRCKLDGNGKYVPKPRLK